MPNRLSSARREQKADEKQRQAEEKFNELAASKRRKIEKKAQRLAEKRSVVALNVAVEAEVLDHQSARLDEESDRNASVEAEPIDVLVQCMTGDEFWLTPLLDSSVADLKQMLSELWGIPSVCQKLLLDCKLLSDSELLCHHMKDDDKVMRCTAVVVIGDILEPSILAKLVLRGGESILNAVFDVVDSEDDATRYQMFVEMRKLAAQGDARAIEALIRLMNTTASRLIRAQILDSLACMTAHCNHVTNAILAQMQHPDASVRIAALQAFMHFAANEQPKHIWTISDCLEDELEDVRFQAVQVLTNIAAAGHADVVANEAKNRLGHMRGGVRRAAVQALSHVIAQSDDQSGCADIFVPLLADADADVRVATVQALDYVAASHGRNIFEALVSVLFDVDWRVRQLTLHALKRFSEKEAGIIIPAALPYLSNQDAMIRYTAVEALGLAKDSGMDEDVSMELNRLLSDSDCLVRDAVARVLGNLPQ